MCGRSWFAKILRARTLLIASAALVLLAVVIAFPAIGAAISAVAAVVAVVDQVTRSAKNDDETTQ
jgi:hypothetical protein